MTPAIRKTVYSDKRVPHFVDAPEQATHRYLSGQRWRYMEAHKHEDFVKWGSGWMDQSHKRQRKVAGLWKDF